MSHEEVDPEDITQLPGLVAGSSLRSRTERADYVYVMAFEGDRIRHMTKIWNDGFSLSQLGWG